MKLNIKSRWSAPLALLATATVVTGCGGGGGSGSGAAPAPVNTAPVVSPIGAQTINQDASTPALTFTVNDDGGLGALKVLVSSADSTLFPPYGLVLGGSGANRTITVTPAEDATGTANVSVTASDAQGNLTSSIFPVTVKAVSQSVAAYTNSTFALMEGDTPVQVSGITFVQDADDDATFTPLLQ
jgi:Big-like domain-containing protein